jgi:ankyrin repeat protein
MKSLHMLLLLFSMSFPNFARASDSLLEPVWSPSAWELRNRDSSLPLFESTYYCPEAWSASIEDALRSNQIDDLSRIVATVGAQSLNCVLKISCSVERPCFNESRRSERPWHVIASPLTFAVDSGSLEAVKAMVRLGVDILYVSAMSWEAGSARDLHHGLRADYKSHDHNRTAIGQSIISNQTEIYQYLTSAIESYSHLDSLQLAALVGSGELLSFVLDQLEANQVRLDQLVVSGFPMIGWTWEIPTARASVGSVTCDITNGVWAINLRARACSAASTNHVDVAYFPSLSGNSGWAMPLPLMVVAAARGFISTVQRLKAAGAKVDVHLEKDGYTPLMAAATYNQIEVVQWLLANGADVNRALVPFFKSYYCPADKPGACRDRALSMAVLAGHPEIVELLLNAGAEPNFTVQSGVTPLTLSIMRQDLISFRLLLQNAADPNLISYGVSTVQPLSALLSFSLVRRVFDLEPWLTLLKDFGADVNHRDSRLSTPLMYAAASCKTDSIKWLLAQPNVDKHAVDQEGFSAYAYAVGSHPKIPPNCPAAGDLLR